MKTLFKDIGIYVRVHRVGLWAMFHNSKSKGQQQEVETVADLWREGKPSQIFGMNSTSRRAFCN